jgi:protease IV
VIDGLEEANKDKNTRGFFVRFGGVSLGLAHATELGETLGRIRAAGRPVFCHGEEFSNATLYAAALGCTKIALSPAGGVEAVGIAAQVVYMRKLLVDELHVTVDYLQVGKSKGAAEPMTRDGPSDEARASLEGTLGDLRATWLDGIKTGRGREDAAIAAEDGPHGPQQAKDRGLVDEISYADDARDAARKAAGAERDDVHYGAGPGSKSDELGGLVRMLAGESGVTAPIALVRAIGSITMGGGGSGILGGGGGISEHDLGRTLARIEKNDAIKALVLRIDSPGGSALASDMLWHELMRIRAKKPIVVSVGEMAASGGYYLASTGSEIFAEPTSIVGSIGVVGGKIGLGAALERFGVHAETFAASKDPKAANRAAYGSVFTGWDPATRARILESMTSVYTLFLSRVSEGRKMAVEKVAESAEGRIFSGREGKARGLVDEMGGLAAAIARARKLASLDADADVALFGRTPGFFDALSGGDAVGGESREDGQVVGVRSAMRASVRGPGATDLLAAFAPDILPFVRSVAPLLSGERTLVAVPFSIIVR